MRRIVPHLWYDKEALAAADFYASVFPDSRVTGRSSLPGTPSGTVDIANLELMGEEFILLAAGPYFSFTPAVSFLVSLGSAEEVDRIAGRLGEGGSTLMPLGSYPFSPRYVWLTDRWGLSWQLMHDASGVNRQRVIPTLMFTGEVLGKAEEAIGFWSSVFDGAGTGEVLRWAAGEEPNRPGTIKRAAFTLEGQDFAAMDSGFEHGFGFNEAISFLVRCGGQAEIDRLWTALSARPEAEQCGWLKDRYGFSWQIVPRAMDDMMADGDPARVARVTEAMLAMKKLDLAGLERAYRGD